MENWKPLPKSTTLSFEKERQNSENYVFFEVIFQTKAFAKNFQFQTVFEVTNGLTSFSNF